MHTHTSLSAPNKRANAPEHGATIRRNREDSTHKRTRNRPFGILPARIARVELGIEALAAIDEDERVLSRCDRMLDVLERQELHVCTAYGLHHSMTASAYASARIRIKELRAKVRLEARERARKLRESVRPEIVNLTAQADKAAA